MTRGDTPGIHDPYWYEIRFAQRHIVRMLDPDSGIRSVTIQAPDLDAIDDVVVRYATAPTVHFQIKHARDARALTFSDLVRVEEGTSLLSSLATGWADVVRQGAPCEVHLLTNRELSARAGTRPADGSQNPPLDGFWRWFSEESERAEELTALQPPTGWENGLAQWLTQLEDLSPREQLEFAQAFHIDSREPDLGALEVEVVADLARLFGVTAGVANGLLALLDRQLSTWATSRRGLDVEITPEKTWTALSAGSMESIGDHLLPPPAPFFHSRDSLVDDLAARLAAGESKTMFLTGPAGCGKSSLVSHLANRAEPVVTLRFHAFKPLTPDATAIDPDAGRLVTAAALWGDLLVQLRVLLSGQLWAERVPIRNDLLLNDPDALRGHVLRLARVIAERQGSPTVIAIDGIDHAARARLLAPELLEGRPSLLDWLVPPEQVPDGIVFLIAGQPGTAGYPTWLIGETPGVERFDVPPVTADDIELLLREDGAVERDLAPSVARTIAEAAQGNTLAAVFAVAEARRVQDAADLRAHLAARHLGPDLDRYYATIWDAATARFEGQRPGMRTQLATALSLSSEPLSGTILSGFFPDYPAAGWDAVLDGLAPIVSERSGAFAVRHNDVRVFLTHSVISSRRASVAAAGAIADFYLAHRELAGCHVDLIRLLTIADRAAEIPGLFSASYVLAALSNGQAADTLLDQARSAITAVQESTSWDDVHHLSLGLASLQQARSVDSYYDLTRSPGPVPPALISERRVAPRGDLTSASFARLIGDLQLLIRGDEVDRAVALASRSLEDYTPPRLLATLQKSDAVVIEEEWRRPDQRALLRLVRDWGATCQSVGLPAAITGARAKKDASWAEFFGGWLEAGVAVARRWTETLDATQIFTWKDFESAVTSLVLASRWEDVRASLAHVARDRSRMPSALRLVAAEWAILASSNSAVASVFVDATVRDGLAPLASTEQRYDPRQLDGFTSLAFTLGFGERARDLGEVTEMVFGAFDVASSDDRTKPLSRVLIHASAWVGRLMAYSRTRADDAPLPVAASEFANILQCLLNPPRDRPALIPDTFFHRAPSLVSRIVASVTPHDPHLELALKTQLLAYAATNSADRNAETVWRALLARGYRAELKGWLEHWLAQDGAAWRLNVGERSELVGRLCVLARAGGCDALADYSEQRLRACPVGYAGRKEYSLISPLDWFRSAPEADWDRWRDDGLRLLAISDASEEAGSDNPISISIEAAVATTAACCGPSSLQALGDAAARKREQTLPHGGELLVEGLIGLLEHSDLAEEEYVAIWALGLGSLVLEVGRDKMWLAHLKQALVASTTRHGNPAIVARLEAMAALEWRCSTDADRWRHPPRWFEASDREPPTADSAPRSEALLDTLRALIAGTDTREYSSVSEYWHRLCNLAMLVEKDHPVEQPECVALLFQLLKRRPRTSNWSFDGFDRLVRAVVPLLNEQQLLQLRLWTVSQIDLVEESPEIWPSAASENLRDLIRFRAAGLEPGIRRACLARELDMHELWLFGAERYRPSPWPPFVVSPSQVGTATSWRELAGVELVRLLGTSGSARCRSAMKGLFCLLANVETTDAQAHDLWTLAPAPGRVRLMEALERLASEHPERFAPWRPLVLTALAAGTAEEQLQALVTLQTHDRAVGADTDRSTLPRTASHDHGWLLKVGRPLLDSPSTSRGHVSTCTGQSASASLVTAFSKVVGCDADALERAVAAHLTSSHTTAPAKPSNEVLPSGDLRISSAGEIAAAVEFLVGEVRAGCFGEVRGESVAQALLSSNEPRIVTTGGTPSCETDLWPDDSRLAELVASGDEEALGSLASTLVLSALQPTERMVAATLRLYAEKHDVVVGFVTGWSRDPFSRGARFPPSTFNGRAHVLYSTHAWYPFQDLNDGWFALPTGGIATMLNGYLPFVPSPMWRDFGWSPRIDNPLEWTHEGAPVARHEFIRGPLRDPVRDALHRHPVLLRWVVSADALASAQQMLTSVPITRKRIEVSSFP